MPERNFDLYVKDFNILPFERVQEKFRKRRLLELLNKHLGIDSKAILEVGPGLNSIFLEGLTNHTGVTLEPTMELFEKLELSLGDMSNILILNQTLEEFALKSQNKFDVVVFSSVLHEIQDVNKNLELVVKLLKPEGLFFVVVPNNQSVHRILGVHLGLLESVDSLTETEILMKQYRNFSPDSLRKLLEKYFHIIEILTSFVKPLSHRQMENQINTQEDSNENLENLYSVSKFFEPFGSEIFAICGVLQ